MKSKKSQKLVKLKLLKLPSKKKVLKKIWQKLCLPWKQLKEPLIILILKIF